MLFKVRNLVFSFPKFNKCNNLKVCRSFSSTADYKEEKVKLGQWNINYLKVGNGPHTLLCAPGALGSIWTDFKPQIEGINKEKFTLIAWDPPGYGKSRPPERDFPANLYERDAEYTYEFMKVLKIPKYSMLGWSDGGIVSMILAARHPEVINKLVLVGCNALILPHELELYNKVRNIDSWSKRMRDPMIAVYGEDLFRRYWAAWTDCMSDVYRANNGDICSGLLKDIKCPTIIFYGQKDPMVDASHASFLHTNIEGSKIHLYPDGKHNIHLAYAEDFNKRIEEFLL